MIAVIDYKAGNGPSVINALRYLKTDCVLSSDRKVLETADGVILPGVGSAEATMASLRELALISYLDEAVRDGGQLFLGICVGMQVLFDHSEEGDCDCLGYIHGQVRRFENGVRIPQMGYNAVYFKGNHPIIREETESDYFYFVNSYYAVPDDPADACGITEYGHPFCSMAAKKNIIGSQFHQEKSGPAGLKLLKRFCDLAEGGTGC